MDQSEVDQHLAIGGHGQLVEHAAHQAVPVGDVARCVVALVAVGGRSEAQAREVTLHQRSDHVAVGGVATDQAVRADGPNIADSRNCHDGCFWHIVSSVRLLGVGRRDRIFVTHLTGQQRFDFGIIEPGQGQVVPYIGQFSQLQCQHLFVPAGIQCQPVIGDDQCPLLRDGQMSQLDHRHLIQPELARGGQTPVPGNDAVVAIDQDRVRPAVLDDAGRDLGNLALGMRARIAGVGNQRLDLAVLDVELVQSGFPKNETRRALPLGGLVES